MLKKMVAKLAVDWVIGTGAGSLARIAVDKALEATPVGKTTKVCIYATSVLASCFIAEELSKRTKKILRLDDVEPKIDVEVCLEV